MPLDASNPADRLTGHALRNAHLRERSLVRARAAPPLARLLVQIRADLLGMTRLEFARRSGISRGTLRDVELGIHTPTRGTLHQFVGFCQQCGVRPEPLEEVRRLYAGPGDTLEQVIARLELRAGSARELARRVGISAVTLWEYRRGNFPVPLPLLRRLCQSVGEDPTAVEPLWHAAERRRLCERGYPEALAEFWVWCARKGYAEKHLPALGLSMTTLRRLRYLELPAWKEVAPAAQALCLGERELQMLKRLWARDQQAQHGQLRDGFGSRLQQCRKQRGITRRELADLFRIGGKKPARIIKHIEEDGFYSAQAYPAGLAALLGGSATEQGRLRELWRERRVQFHRRHRPETRTELRLARELYGFELRDMEAILGYTSLEYQRIERGVSPLPATAQARILEALHRAGQRRVEALLQQRRAREAERMAWQAPPTLAALIGLLAKREGGLIPLARYLRQAGLQRLGPGRLRAIAQGEETPAWQVLEQVGRVCGVLDLSEARRGWRERFRARLQRRCTSPLGIELRVLIAEVAASPRAFSPRLGFHYSVLVRDLQRLDRDDPVKWFRVERILRTAGLSAGSESWREIHALWYTAKERRKSPLHPQGLRNHQSNGLKKLD
jgi:transcriptional regulator with XRE-family HTH domain